mmetsp:Transcript_26121/g.50787  ORF Transcript_26121/g.50787 Transcript_26121/m.50787 type:complete len:217 (-) Transcript_26121:204-854(-)
MASFLSKWSRGYVDVKVMGPCDSLLMTTLGASWFRRIPIIANSCSNICRCSPARFASMNSITKSADLADAITCRPLPIPIAAPSMIPGRSRICIFACLYSKMPGMHVNVVNSYPATLEVVLVRFVKNVDLPTDGNPIRATLASPALEASNALSLSDAPPPCVFGLMSSDLKAASLALSFPRWYSVALFFCVDAISSSMALILPKMPLEHPRGGGWW